MRKCILLVDDDSIVQKFVSKILRDDGYEVEIAGDGNDALAHIEARTFDLILMDVNMPNLDGIQLLDIIQKKDIPTPVVFMTGDDEHVFSDRGLELDSLQFLLKPVKPFLLLQKIYDLIK
ncbi:MAG: response regulator [bacterium]|nr:response regulator [bacterium]